MGFNIEIPAGSPFSIDNIPYGVIKTKENPTPRCASAIGDYAIDLDLYIQHAGSDVIPSGSNFTHAFSEVGDFEASVSIA